MVDPTIPTDRLTALPDHLRLHILSFLPYKSAVTTSLLSSTWRHLWTHRHPSPSNLSLAAVPTTPLLLRHVTSPLLLLLLLYLDYAAAISVSDLSLVGPAPLYLHFWAHSDPNRFPNLQTLTLALQLISVLAIY